MLKANKHKHTENELSLFSEYATYFDKSPLPTEMKLQGFAKYVRRQDISRFLAKNELFKAQIDAPGVIIECGTYIGQGLMTFSQLSSIYEPYNHTRKIIGFDTFRGFPSVNKKDLNKEYKWSEGDLYTIDNIEDEIKKAIELHDSNRPIKHIEKTQLIPGDATKTIPKFIQENKHLVISMLYLDFDIYDPTKVAIDNFISRIPKGGIIAFDELNAGNCPGETMALLDSIGIQKLKLQKTPFDPYISFAKIDG